jgi:hypothetical protein
MGDSLRMPNTKFEICQDKKLLRFFYTSDNKEMSITDKRKICKLLEIPYESVYFRVTSEAIDSEQLPYKPTFKNERGRKYWL